VGNISKTAGPQFLKAFENVAIPFLRRSAAATVAGFTAVTQDIQSYGVRSEGSRVGGGGSAPVEQALEKDLGAIHSNAVKASSKAGKAIDGMELVEKSRDLSKGERVSDCINNHVFAEEDVPRICKLQLHSTPLTIIH